MKVIEELKSLREKKGISRRELASRLGVSHLTIYRMEKGLNAPSAELLERIANELGYTLTIKHKRV